MANFKDLINLVGTDGGKVFVIDEAGEVKLVVLGVEDYQRLLLGKLKQEIADIESINQEIVNAQLQDNLEPIGPSVTKRAQELFKSRPGPDLRSEVVDPDFDLNANDDEVIRPSFDDI